MPKVNVNGITINYEEVGQRAADPPHLRPRPEPLRVGDVAPVLAEHHRVITFDNRGTGQSDVPEGPYTMEQLATTPRRSSTSWASARSRSSGGPWAAWSCSPC